MLTQKNIVSTVDSICAERGGFTHPLAQKNYGTIRCFMIQYLRAFFYGVGIWERVENSVIW